VIEEKNGARRRDGKARHCRLRELERASSNKLPKENAGETEDDHDQTTLTGSRFRICEGRHSPLRSQASIRGILAPYLIGIGIYLFARDRAFVVASIGNFWIGPALLVFMLISAIHMDLGMRTIVEDYVQDHFRKLLFLNSAFIWTVCLLCVFAILRMMFEAAHQ
jgi:succinate dehydrogenase / fumarate reductase membrane anchor subunit